MQVWLLKWLLGVAYSFLLKKIGQTATAQHLEAVVTKYTPLAPEVNPPPMRSNNPNLEDHYGGL